MLIAINEMVYARETLHALLDEVGLAAYRFHVEPGESDTWSVAIECAADDGWQTVGVVIDTGLLDRARDADGPRQKLLTLLRAALADCGLERTA